MILYIIITCYVLLYVSINLLLLKIKKTVYMHSIKPISNNLSKIVICNYDNRNTPIYRYCKRNVEEYCKLHGYINRNFKHCDHSPWWCKLFFIKKLLQEKTKHNTNAYDYIVWIDSDAIFVKPDIRIESVIDDRYSITIGVDNYNVSNIIKLNGTFKINSGFFIIRNNDIGIEFINECISIYESQKSRCLQSVITKKLKSTYAGYCYEQYVMAKLIANEYKNHTNMLDRNIVWNDASYPTRIDPFVYHIWQWMNSKGLAQLERKFDEVEFKKKIF